MRRCMVEEKVGCSQGNSWEGVEIDLNMVMGVTGRFDCMGDRDERVYGREGKECGK